MLLDRRCRFAVVSFVFFVAPAAAGAQRADTVVKNVGAPLHAGIASLVQELSIGTADGDDHYILGDPNDLAVTKDGSILVLDQTVPEIRMYTAAGKYVKTISRKGRGPGEFTASSGILALDDGRILHWDTGNWRINVFSATGDHLTQWTTPSGSSGSSTSSGTGRMVVDRNGILYTARSIITFGADFKVDEVWIRRKLDGTLIDTIRPPVMPRSDRSVKAQVGGSSQSANIPFDPSTAKALSPLGYFVTGYPDRYAFEIHQPSGSILSVRRDVKPRPVTAQERDTAKGRITERMRNLDPAWSWNGPEIPRVKPAYGSLAVAQDGRIWINTTIALPSPPSSAPSGGGSASLGGRSGPPPGPRCPSGDEALYDVFEPDGRYVGQVRVPARVSMKVRKGDVVWATTCDADDIPMVKRYRIAWR